MIRFMVVKRGAYKMSGLGWRPPVGTWGFYFSLMTRSISGGIDSVDSPVDSFDRFRRGS